MLCFNGWDYLFSNDIHNLTKLTCYHVLIHDDLQKTANFLCFKIVVIYPVTDIFSCLVNQKVSSMSLKKETFLTFIFSTVLFICARAILVCFSGMRTAIASFYVSCENIYHISSRREADLWPHAAVRGRNIIKHVKKSPFLL